MFSLATENVYAIYEKLSEDGLVQNCIVSLAKCSYAKYAYETQKCASD